VERRLARHSPAGPEAAILVSYTALVAIAALMAAVNPFSLVLLVPAAVVWPLARPGPWLVSRLPAWAALSLVAVAVIDFALRYHLGWDVWWYLFLLLENRTIPFAPVALGITFVAATALLGHDLHRSAALATPQRPRRRGGRGRRRRSGDTTESLAVSGSTRDERSRPAEREAGGPPEGGPPAPSSRRRSRRRRSASQ